MDEQYLQPITGARWAISRWIDGRWITLVQDSYLDQPDCAAAVLRALSKDVSLENLDRYFPVREGQGPCPTLEIMEMTSVLDPTNPIHKRGSGTEVGV